MVDTAVYYNNDKLRSTDGEIKSWLGVNPQATSTA